MADDNNNPWAHLEGGGGGKEPPPAAAAAAAAVSFMPIVNDDDEDEELQKALALSIDMPSALATMDKIMSMSPAEARQMQAKIDAEADHFCNGDWDIAPAAAAAASTTASNNSNRSSSNNNYPVTNVELVLDANNKKPHLRSNITGPPPLMHTDSKHELFTTTVEKTDNFNCISFHKLMWDDNITTTNDKERWIYECITTSSSSSSSSSSVKNNDGGGEDVAMKSGEEEEEDQQPNNRSSSNTTTTTDLLESFTSQQQSFWGLTQRHGGPCGILAAIQAEMIRVLLWGRRRYEEDDGTNSNGKGGSRSFDYPYSPSGFEALNNQSKAPTTSEVDEAMAMAIAMILARASITPAASSEKPSGSCSVRLVFPNTTSDDNSTSNTSTKPAAAAAASANGEADTKVQQSPWIEEMLKNSSSSNSASSSSSKTPGLSTYSIAATLSSSDKNDDSDTSPETKRPRKKEVSFSNNTHLVNNSNKPVLSLTPQQIKITNLANAVSDYLLGRHETTIDDGNNNNKKSSSTPLDFFRSPGGVMFFVMSLVESRGIDRIKSDMDDPTNTITSQFGHSSQELMNLLLTGQAVSNVFDNSMTLSEELTCRGIQYRSAIGYLSQLESLRYCEVGSYYKSPIFPIWIVASTNHFSVVFGDSTCLQESKSDLLLERCRRAFKKVEDGESGFIMKESLGKVVEELDLMTMLGDNGVQTLAAFVEVPGGGGIVLWDDFWKACSRLLTGSSLQAIMNDKDDDEVKIIGTINRQATPPPATMTSDEELARKLAAEWGSMPGDDSMPGLEPLPVITTPAQSKPLSLCPPNVDPDVFNSLPLEMQQEIVMEHERTSNIMDMDGESDLEKKLICGWLQNAEETDTQLATADDAGTLSVPFGPAQKPSPDRPSEDDSLFSDAKKPAAKEPVLLLTDSTTQTQLQQPDFEKHGHTFPLYHYNGLRGGCLTPFRVTRLSAEEAVGASISLSSKGGLLLKLSCNNRTLKSMGTPFHSTTTMDYVVVA